MLQKIIILYLLSILFLNEVFKLYVLKYEFELYQKYNFLIKVIWVTYSI